MHRFVTFFKKEIFAEVMMPAKPSRKVFIICNGAPSVPSKKTLMEFLSRKGYWVIHIRYRGTWESKGVFLKKTLDQDLIDVIDQLPKGFIDLWSGEHYKLKFDQIVIAGSSFGGPAVILASRDPRVSKAVAFSPVVDWLAPSYDEPTPQYIKYMQEAYGQVYRTSASTWRNLAAGKIYQAIGHEKEIDPNKLLVIHAKDDRVVRIKEVEQFAKKSKAPFMKLRSGGHMGTSTMMEPKLWKTISKFLKSTPTTTRKSS